MKFKVSLFTVVLCFAPYVLWAAAPLTGNSGDNLTAFNGNVGAMNNNAWNQMINPGKGTAAPTADFGNCNSLILRCAQPKCASGGCISAEIAYPIVAGCVMSNDTCKTHGELLIQAITSQLVANSTARVNEQQAAAAAAANQQASAQSAAQMQQMQMQMQQMQSQMAQQNADSAATIQAALDEQRRIAEQQAAATAAAEAARAAAAPAVQVTAAANMGVSADVLAREQASGQILTQLENSMTALSSLKRTMQNVFDYAGCDSSGNNCRGPRRVRVFKDKASEFFDPYETVLDEVYDALILAQSLGVDITDIYMMLNGSCNVWGKYLCTNGQTMHYTNDTCKNDGVSHPDARTSVRGGARCKVGQVVPMSDGGCQLLQMLTDQDTVQQNWNYPDQRKNSNGDIESEIRVGCASEAIENSTFFRTRKKQATIDIDVLRRIIEQDAPNTIPRGQGVYDIVRFCSVNEEGLDRLQRYAGLKTLPSRICVPDATGQNGLNRGLELYIDSSALSDAEYNDYGYTYEEVCKEELALERTLRPVPSVAKCEQIGDMWRVTGGNDSNRWKTETTCRRSVPTNRKCITDGQGGWQRVNISLDENAGKPKSAMERANKCGTYASNAWNRAGEYCNCNMVTDDTKHYECKDVMREMGDVLPDNAPVPTTTPSTSRAATSTSNPASSMIAKLPGTQTPNFGSNNSARMTACNTFKGFWDFTTNTCNCFSATDFSTCTRLTT